MVITGPQTKTALINRLFPDIFFLIIQRLPIKNRFVLKTVCKMWRTFIISRILPNQDKLSIETDYMPISRCIDPDHKLDFRGNHSIPILSVKTNKNLRRFIAKELTGLKVLKYIDGGDESQVIKSYLSEGSSLSLQCLDIWCLEEPLVKVLANLQHFSASRINAVSLASVFHYCPILTHLSINMEYTKGNFVDILMNLPKGLQYLKLEGVSNEVLVVFCSPAMQTLKSVVLRNWTSFQLFSIPDARVKPAPRLQRFSMSRYMYREEDRRMTVDFFKECPVLKKIDLRGAGLTLEDCVNIYSRLSNLEMIQLALQFGFHDVIRMILSRNKTSLKYLNIGNSHFLNLESMKTLAEFTSLQILYFHSLAPSNEQLIAFAQRRLHVSQSRLQLKSNAWNENHLSDTLGSVLHNANIELVENELYPSVMD